MPFRSFSVDCSERSVFNFVSFSLGEGIVVEIWFVGSGTLPSGTITFPDGVVMFGGGGGVLPFVATVAGGVEPVAGALLAAGTPADGFFATRARGFLGLGAGALAEVVFVDSVAGATVV